MSSPSAASWKARTRATAAELMRSDYDAYMDRLVITISQSIPEGTETPDVISACAAIIGYALADVPVEKRDRVFASALAFIDEVCATRVAHDWCHGGQR